MCRKPVPNVLKLYKETSRIHTLANNGGFKAKLNKEKNQIFEK